MRHRRGREGTGVAVAIQRLQLPGRGLKLTANISFETPEDAAEGDDQGLRSGL